VEFDILYNEGISHSSLLVDLGVEHGIIDKSGARFSYGDLRLGQGKENARQFLVENPDVAGEVYDRLKGVLGITTSESDEEEATDASDE
jgi:recombination protein RecA